MTTLLELAEVKTFLRNDFEDDDTYITELIQTSEDYLIDAVGNENYTMKILNDRFKRKARLFCLVIIQDCYDNRTFVTKDSEKIRLIISGILFQMQYSTFEVGV